MCHLDQGDRTAMGWDRDTEAAYMAACLLLESLPGDRQDRMQFNRASTQYFGIHQDVQHKH